MLQWVRRDIPGYKSKERDVTSKTKSCVAGLLLAASFGAVAPAHAELGGGFSANVTMLSDYRFRGVSQNDEDFALQGGIDWQSDQGFYVGTWASNISDLNGASMETNLYGGYAGEANGVTYDVGGLLYHYPGGEDTDFFEVYGAVGMDLGLVSASLGANYAFSNKNLGDEDNIYIYGNGDVAIPDMPITARLHLGYEDGAFGDGKWDWSLGGFYNFKGLELGVSYVDTNKPGDNSDATVIFSVGASF